MQTEKWDIEITPKSSFLNFDFKEVWKYRDLLSLFIKREIVAVYKQTILGPLWFFIQPILTTLVFTVIFGNIAKMKTDDIGTPHLLFYLSGILLWTYFADAINNTSNTFTANAAIFGKVYFPRIIMPLAKVISNLLKFCIQVFLFICFYGYFIYSGKMQFEVTANVLLLPVFLVIMICLGMGLGMIISSFTNKYKDLTFLVGFGVQLLMYASSVIISLDVVKEKNPQYYNYIAFNPIAQVIEAFRRSVLGGEVNYGMLLYALIFSIIILFIGMLVFGKTEKSFIDTV